MNVDELVATFATINDRAALIAFLAPLRLPPNLSEQEKARVTAALLVAAGRCWKGGALEMKNDSPTFVATFADGVVTRMTTHCESDTKLDMTRGVVLARHAYRQRTGREPVALTKAHFERDGTLLQAYSAIDMTVCG